MQQPPKRHSFRAQSSSKYHSGRPTYHRLQLVEWPHTRTVALVVGAHLPNKLQRDRYDEKAIVGPAWQSLQRGLSIGKVRNKGEKHYPMCPSLRTYTSPPRRRLDREQYRCTGVTCNSSWLCRMVIAHDYTSAPVYRCTASSVYWCNGVPAYWCTSLPLTIAIKIFTPENRTGLWPFFIFFHF